MQSDVLAQKRVPTCTPLLQSELRAEGAEKGVKTEWPLVQKGRIVWECTEV